MRNGIVSVSVRNRPAWRPWLLLVALSLAACGSPITIGTGTGSPSTPPGHGPAASAASTIAQSPTVQPTHEPTPRITGSADLVAYRSGRGGSWFSVPLGEVPGSAEQAAASYVIGSVPVANRDGGQVSPSLAASYVFLQFDHITVADLEKNIGTIRALFIRSALMSFVDYRAGRVLGWDGRSISIPLDVRGFVRVCNQHGVPVFLEVNYSDYAAGKVGTGIGSLVRTDNIAGTVAYLDDLANQGLHVDGVTFGDEIGDDNGWGDRKPTLQNTDLVARFVAYATALKKHQAGLRIYAFDSSIGAASGEIAGYWEPLSRIHAAEQTSGTTLLDGFAFRESYVYIDAQRNLRPSQEILDDTESLYRDAPVYRYDTDGSTGANPDRDYLHTLLAKTAEIFGRRLDIALTEYLPAGPVQISESDTTRYADIDFILHYADVMGIYSQLGLDEVATFTFANSPQQSKAYLDRFGGHGPNYPVRAQLARYLAGEMLSVSGSAPYDTMKVKVYAFGSGGDYFVMILNKDASAAHAVRVRLPGQFDLTVNLPSRSYTSLVVDGKGVTVSGIGA
jgi:hypothetical protein